MLKDDGYIRPLFSTSCIFDGKKGLIFIIGGYFLLGVVSINLLCCYGKIFEHSVDISVWGS